MSIPREAVRLVGDVDKPKLLGRKSGKDWTEQMQFWGRKRLDLLDKENLCGYIFKHGSPSNAMGRMKVFQSGGASFILELVYGHEWLWIIFQRFLLRMMEDYMILELGKILLPGSLLSSAGVTLLRKAEVPKCLLIFIHVIKCL